jgi:Flp pilus assembly protein TadB
MPLSEYEQRILNEIERRLASEDPRFARDAAAHTPEGQSVKKLKRASFLFVGGFALLIAGVVLGLLGHGAWLWVFGLAAFGVMLFSAVRMAALVKHLGKEHVRSSRSAQAPGWFNRLEERWRRRFDNEDE